jgi:hypothetical protein
MRPRGKISALFFRQAKGLSNDLIGAQTNPVLMLDF